MTRILVQRGSSSSSPSQSCSSVPSSSTSQLPSNPSLQISTTIKDGDVDKEVTEQVVVGELPEHSLNFEGNISKGDGCSFESVDQSENGAVDCLNGPITESDDISQGDLPRSLLGNSEPPVNESEEWSLDGPESFATSPPPPPPIPPSSRLVSNNSCPRRPLSGSSTSSQIGPSRSPSGWPLPSRSSSSGSRPSSPRSHVEVEGYNSADEQNPCFESSYGDMEREQQFEIDIRRSKGLELKRMLEDGNCLFRAVADQVYGGSESYDVVRQMCIDYMERERDHFSQFITEGFTSYCKRKRRDKVYGNNVEIQAMSEMYNQPIHIYSYSTDPINIFHGSYNTDSPPIRLSYHYGNHYNSLVDPHRLTVGAGLGFSCLRGRNVDTDQVKAAIKAQQDQQIDNALVAEGKFYSDLELTEKEIEHMVMEASRAEYLADDKFRQQIGFRESSTSSAEPSPSGARPSCSDTGEDVGLPEAALSSSMQMVLSMGFTYLQTIEAYSIFGDNVDSMICYLLETSNSSRRKGKATE